MLDGAIIIGITMVVTEMLKVFPFFKTIPGKCALQLCVLAIAAVLMICNAIVFGGMEWRVALAKGIELGAIASGVYSIGKESTKLVKSVESK